MDNYQGPDELELDDEDEDDGAGMMLRAAAEPSLLRFSAPVEIQAALESKDGEPPKRPTFEMIAYTGVPMNAGGFYSPVVVELSGVKTANAQIPILLDHDPAQIIGQGQAKADSAAIRVIGEVMGATAESQKVVALAKDGFKWQASIGANVTRREFLEAGKKAIVNGREVAGPMIIARESLLQEVSFVAIGADHQTSAAVAASQPQGRGIHMDPQFKTWLEANGYANVENLTPQQIKPLEAAWKAETAPAPKAPAAPNSPEDVLAKARLENERREKIADITAQFLADGQCSADMIAAVEALCVQASQAKWTPEKYEHELLKATRPQFPVFRPSLISERNRLNDKVLTAAICQAGRLGDHEKMFDEQTLQAAHDRFKGRISLNQAILLCAEANGYRGDYSGTVTLEAQRAAFGMTAPNRIQASAGFSTLSISNVIAATANKFLFQGWLSVDQTALRISKIRNVRNFQTVTTVSLIADTQFDKLGPTGEIKHGTLSDQTYTNQADTYARMLAITRKDLINDDLGALTDVPTRLGRGAGLLLNYIFWTAFLGMESNNFTYSSNNNINTGVADSTVGGLAATEAIFLNQTDPNGDPLGVMPAILVVPTAQKAAFLTLMTAEALIGGSSVTPGTNIWRGRFRVESSPYMSNSSYTGYSTSAWYMLADPNELAAIEIAALNGRVEPTVEQADADFNVLGIQMRGYSDVGVARQEYRAVVKADGGSS